MIGANVKRSVQVRAFSFVWVLLLIYDIQFLVFYFGKWMKSICSLIHIWYLNFHWLYKLISGEVLRFWSLTEKSSSVEIVTNVAGGFKRKTRRTASGWHIKNFFHWVESPSRSLLVAESIELRRHCVHSSRTLFLFVENAAEASQVVLFSVDHRKHVSASLHHLLVLKGVFSRFILIWIRHSKISIWHKKLLRILIPTFCILFPANSVRNKLNLL